MAEPCVQILPHLQPPLPTMQCSTYHSTKVHCSIRTCTLQTAFTGSPTPWETFVLVKSESDCGSPPVAPLALSKLPQSPTHRLICYISPAPTSASGMEFQIKGPYHLLSLSIYNQHSTCIIEKEIRKMLCLCISL